VRATVRDFLENDRWSGHALSVSCTSRSAGPTPQARSMRPQGRTGAPHVRKRQVLAPDKRRYLHRRRRAYKRSRDGGEVRIGQSLSVRPHRSCDVRGLRRRYRSHGGLGRLPLATSVASEAAPLLPRSNLRLPCALPPCSTRVLLAPSWINSVNLDAATRPGASFLSDVD
jgi:hypothetical protein